MTNPKTISSVLVSFILLVFMLTACGENENETVVSGVQGTNSHRMGENCMSCHKSGGEGEGWFVVAGTVYKADLVTVQPDGYVKLYTGANGSGTLKATIAVDGKGNFFTTNSIDFAGGLYTTVTSKSGNVSYMNSPVTDGKCNACHGSTSNKIFVN
jgi:hypothetical protein